MVLSWLTTTSFLCRILVQRLNSRVTQLAAAEHQALQHAAAARQEAQQSAAEAGLHHVLPVLRGATIQSHAIVAALQQARLAVCRLQVLPGLPMSRALAADGTIGLGSQRPAMCRQHSSRVSSAISTAAQSTGTSS
jgi:hypothetical protein